MDLDTILQDIGQFGRYQVVSYTLFIFPIMYSAFPVFSYILTTSSLKYRCFVPECEDKDTVIYHPQWLQDAVPFLNTHTPQSCFKYRAPERYVASECPVSYFHKNITDRCNQWVFSDKTRTIVYDFEIMCQENDWKRTLIGTLNNAGQFIGLPIGGFLSDRYGRKILLVLSCVVSTVFGLARSFSNSYIMFATLEFLDALAGTCIFSTCFVLGLEIVGPKRRTIASVLMNCCFSIGGAMLGLAWWYFEDWRLLLRVMYAPGLLFIFYMWLIPESIRWLSIHGRYEEAVEIIKKIASVNKKNLPEEALPEDAPSKQLIMNTEQITVDKKDSIPVENVDKFESKKKSQFTQILQSKRLLLRVMVLSFVWMIHTFVYYGLSLNSLSVEGNSKLNFILVSLVEIPGYIATLIFTDWLGRRISLFIALATSGASCIAFHFLTREMVILRLILYMIGKFSITMSFTVLYVFTAELLPTTVRHLLLSLCSMIGRIGSMIAPQTPLLAIYIDPVIVFGVFSWIGGLISLYFPETLNKKLPDTMEEANKLGIQ